MLLFLRKKLLLDLFSSNLFLQKKPRKTKMGRHASVSHIPPLQIRPNTVFLARVGCISDKLQGRAVQKKNPFPLFFSISLFCCLQNPERGNWGMARMGEFNSFKFFVQSKRRVAHIQLGRKGKEKDPRTLKLDHNYLGAPEKQEKK